MAMVFAVAGLPSCKRVEKTSSPAAQDKTAYKVQGILLSINFADQTVTVDHEDIPGYMPAMTMPFNVKAMSEVEPLKSGDPIEFTMFVTDDASWIEGVKKIARSEVQIAEKKKVSGTAAGAKAARLKEGDPLPDFELIDSKKRPITKETFSGKPLLLTFIFTRCPVPDFCPRMMNHFQELQRGLGSNPVERDVQLLSVSFDPAFDTPEVLAEYGARYSGDADRWRFATGDPAEITKLTQAFSLSVQPESDTINHSLATALVDQEGVIRKIWRGNGWQPAEALQAVRELEPQLREPKPGDSLDSKPPTNSQ